ncbi:MAG TPA: hypothetical protein VG603_08715 [Chitinophagales bacterium]|nr:hypothetical protein [Chitinophagales bacterium]
MGKRILGILAGVGTAVLVTMVFEYVGMLLFPPPVMPATQNPQDLAGIMDKMPPMAFAWLLLGYAVGSFAGGAVATGTSGRETFWSAVITGLIVMAGGVMNLVQIHHPLWFVIISQFVYVPFALLGFAALHKKSQ